jgi:hypothetical protein
MLTSSTTTSSLLVEREHEALGAVGCAVDDLEVRVGGEDRRETPGEDVVVVDDQDLEPRGSVVERRHLSSLSMWCRHRRDHAARPELALSCVSPSVEGLA